MTVATEGYTLTRLADDTFAVRNPEGKVYRVTTTPQVKCTCWGFRRWGYCKHPNMLKEAGMISDSIMIPGPGDMAEAPERAVIAIPSTGIARLAAALGKAQAACKPVSHDAHNTHQNYAYTSSEAIIAEGKQALASAGLSLLPVRQSLNGWERHGEDRFELERHFLLLHSSGETLPLCVHWPVCPGKGRPLDKATAAAATLSLSYLLRDLLLMPRVDPADEVNARDDTPKQAPRAAPKATDDEVISEQEAREIDVLLGRTKTEWARLRDEWFRTKFKDVGANAQTVDLTVRQAAWLKKKLLEKFAKQQLDEAVRT